MPNTLENKVALVTGAGSGIGAATAKRLGEAGAKVVLLGRTAKELEKTAEEVRKLGSEALSLVVDITDETALAACYQQVHEEWGRLDSVFANAGVNGVWAPLEELSLEEWNKTLNINLTGTFLTVKHALPALKKQGGAIVITSSVNGTRMFSNTGATAYACTKAAQVAFAKMTALELAKHKVRVNVICPGAITTDINENTEQRDLEKVREPVEYPEGEIPLTDGTPGSADDVAELVLFLVSDVSKHITGTEMWIDGGQSLLQG
jgi:NAD(P)-dependent dehydrogenase (short-subunit alcohol dehydrogenase family)